MQSDQPGHDGFMSCTIHEVLDVVPAVPAECSWRSCALAVDREMERASPSGEKTHSRRHVASSFPWLPTACGIR
jgi:hypothetical protein